MTNAQHTPGPWEAIEVAEGRFAIGAAYRDENNMPMEGFIADVPVEANARLIAAAPKLLEALERAVIETIDAFKDDPIGQEYTSAWIVQARAAIAKAKGGAA